LDDGRFFHALELSGVGGRFCENFAFFSFCVIFIARIAVHDNMCSHEYTQNPFLVLLSTLEKSLTPLAAILFAGSAPTRHALGAVAAAF
jgi:hypothetical protein